MDEYSMDLLQNIVVWRSSGSLSSRSKDVFDLDWLTPKCDFKKLKTSLVNTFSSRGTELPKSISDHINEINLDVLRNGWPSVVSGMEQAHQFDVVFKRVVELCKKIES